MNGDDIFYGQEEEGFEELVEKSLTTKSVNFNDNKENENLISDTESENEVEQYEDKTTAKREARLQSVMKMTRNPLAALDENERKDEKKIKSNVAMLCSALGGFDPNPPNEYFLGMEGLGCLKDLKRLLKTVDEEKHVLNVASACHDSGLFVNDLIPIMVQYGMSNISNADPQRLSLLLATLELLVKLLTPIQMNDDDLDDKLFSKLKRAQIEYKYHLLHYKKGKIFKYVIALMIPILQLDKKDVTMRDKIILNLCLTLFANVLRIQPSDANIAKKNRKNIIHIFEELPAGITADDTSPDVVFEVFKRYEVLSVVQTVASNLSKEFDTNVLGTACLDFYYYTFLYIDPLSLMGDNVRSSFRKGDSLSKKLNLSDAAPELTRTNNKLLQLRELEQENIRKFKSKSATRHANFGSLINVQDKKYNNRVLSGQDKLRNDDIIALLDSNASKTDGGKPLHFRRNDGLDDESNYIGTNYKTRDLLRRFVEDFIQNGFGVVCKEISDVMISGEREFTKPEFIFQYHYFFVINWIFKFEENYQANHKRSVKTVERFKYLFFCFGKNMINTLLNKLIPLYSERKQYNCLKITVSILREILQAVLTMHSYENFDDTRLLNDDKLILKAMVSRAESTLRFIFEVDSTLMELFKLPQNSHKKLPSVGMEMIRFTHTSLKVINYILKLKVPIMLVRKQDIDFDDDTNEEERRSSKNLKKYKLLDKNYCEKFRDLLFHDQTVNTHIWLFSQFEEINQEKLNLCLSYFSKLLKKWEVNIFKLIRLDFMYILHEFKKTKNAEISESLISDFGDLMSFFMHKLIKLYHNAPLVLLEAMFNTEVFDAEIKEYYLTGNPFSTSTYTAREQRRINRTGNEDVNFVDDLISKEQKVTFIVSYLFYEDNAGILEQLVEFLTQWYHELTNTIDDNVKIVSKLNLFRIEGACYKEARTNPYFRLLCNIGDIVNGILVKRDEAALLKFKQLIEVTLNTPLDSYELENKFDDPNLINRETKRQNVKRRKDDDDDDEGEAYYRDSHHGYGDEGINDNDDLAGSGDEGLDELELAEAQLSSLSNRVKGKAMVRKANGELKDTGKSRKKSIRKTTKEEKLKNKKKLRKRRKIVKDDDEALSDTEIMRRANLSKKYIDDSDEDMDNDEEFYARELQLQRLLQKRQGLITKEQYHSLISGTLELDEISDLDDNLVAETEKKLGPQTAHSKPDEELLTNLLQPSLTDEDGSDEDGSDGDEQEEDEKIEHSSENDTFGSDDDSAVKLSNNEKEIESKIDYSMRPKKTTKDIELSDDDYDAEKPGDLSVESNKLTESSEKAGAIANDRTEEQEQEQPEEDLFASLLQIHEQINSKTGE